MNDAILKFRRYEDASLEYTGVNRHASDTHIGLTDCTAPIEAMLDYDKEKKQTTSQQTPSQGLCKQFGRWCGRFGPLGEVRRNRLCAVP